MLPSFPSGAPTTSIDGFKIQNAYSDCKVHKYLSKYAVLSKQSAHGIDYTTKNHRHHHHHHNIRDKACQINRQKLGVPLIMVLIFPSKYQSAACAIIARAHIFCFFVLAVMKKHLVQATKLRAREHILRVPGFKTCNPKK